MMYESPIKMIVDDMAEKLIKNQEGYIVKCVQNVGVSVDKAELVRALAYDRQQYEKGFADGKKEAQQWIPVEERLPDKVGWVLTSIFHEYTHELITIMRWYSTAHGFEILNKSESVKAWMPMPEPYKGEERWECI